MRESEIDGGNVGRGASLAYGLVGRNCAFALAFLVIFAYTVGVCGRKCREVERRERRFCV